MSLNALIALGFSDKRKDSPIFGVAKNPNALQVACVNCIGACCIGGKLAHGEPTDTKRFSQIHGCVHQALLPEEAVANGSRLWGFKTSEELLKHPYMTGMWRSVANNLIETASTMPTNTMFSLCGPCGELMPNGNCGAHECDRSGLCTETKAGDPFCTNHFIAFDSPAAEIFQSILNRALPTLNQVRLALGLPHSSQMPFNFIQGK